MAGALRASQPRSFSSLKQKGSEISVGNSLQVPTLWKSFDLLKNLKSTVDLTFVAEVAVHMALHQRAVNVVVVVLPAVIACPFMQIVLPPQDQVALVLTCWLLCGLLPRKIVTAPQTEASVLAFHLPHR